MHLCSSTELLKHAALSRTAHGRTGDMAANGAAADYAECAAATNHRRDDART